jgi:cell division septation protein DedD
MGQMLNSEHFGLVMHSLALPITGDLGVNAFVEAIQRQADNERKAAGGSAAAAAPSASPSASSTASTPSSTSPTPSTPAKKTEEPKKS